MLSNVTVIPRARQIRRIARLCIDHGNEEVKITFHRSGFLRLTIWNAGNGQNSGTRYTITPRGSIAQEEEI